MELINSTVILQAITSGVLLGTIYMLVALGFTIVFGVLGIVNFAHGQLTMLAMYLAMVLFNSFHIDPFLAVPVNAVIFFVVGIIVYQLIMRPAVEKPHATQIVLTLGLILLIQNLVLLNFGGNIRGITTIFTSLTIPIGSVYLSVPRILAALLALLVVVLLYFMLKRTDLGKSIRATADSRDGAHLVGIAVPRVYMIAFGLAAALEGIAGSVMVPYTSVSPFFGFELGLKAFVIVVIAGLGSLPGAVLGGLLVGLMETMGTVFFSASFNTVLTFGFLVLVLIFRPTGLFRQK